MSEGTTSARRILRVIKRPDRPLPGIEVTEHTERDSGFLLSAEFGKPEFEPEPPAELSLQEEQPSRVERVFQGRK